MRYNRTGNMVLRGFSSVPWESTPKVKMRSSGGTPTPTLDEMWATYVGNLEGEPFQRGRNDCCAFAMRWASAISDKPATELPEFSTDEEAEAYLKHWGGLEELARDELRALEYKETMEPRFYNWAIVIFETGDPKFPHALGVYVGKRIATRIEKSARAMTLLSPSRVQVLAAFQHPKLMRH